MANGAIAGGIGAGILGGLQFMRQREADARADQALQNQNQILQMQQAEHGYKVAEQDRKGKMLQGYQKVMAEPGLTDMERYTKFSNEYGQFMTPAEHLEIRKATDPMVQAFGSDALNKAIYSRDLSDLQKVADMRAPGSKIAFSEDGKNLIVSTPDAKQSTMDFNGLAAAYSLRDWQKDQAAKSKAALETRKTEAEIEGIKAKSSYLGRLPQDKFSFGASGAGRGGKGGKEDKIDPIKDLKDFNDAIGVDPESKQPYPWAPTALQHYKQIMAANPDLSGTEAGAQYILNMAQALGKGAAQAVPEIDQNGSVNLVASWPGANGKGGPVKINLQKNIDPAGVIEAQGVGGNQIVKPDEWTQIQGNAVQSYARTRPDEYRLAAEASGDDAKMAALAQRAQTNPDAARALNFAKMVRSLNEQQKTVTAKPGKTPLSAEDKRVADALGYDPDAPGVVDKATDVGNRFLESAKGFLTSTNGDQFESAIRMAQRAPGMPGVRQKLFEMARGNPERMARIEEVFGKSSAK